MRFANSEEAKPYAFGFAVPVNAQGLRFICRPSVIHGNPGSPMDYPLSSRLFRRSRLRLRLPPGRTRSALATTAFPFRLTNPKRWMVF